MTGRYIVGDVFDVLATLEPDSVDLVFSSPPFLALRSYLPADHPDKAKEIGSEATPADFLDTLLDVVEACDRVLAPHGSLCFELGDTFAGSGGAGGDYLEGGWRDGAPGFDGSARTQRGVTRRLDYSRERGGGASAHFDAEMPKGGMGWPLDKSLCMIPTLFAASLAYGRNLLRPERETPRWRIRNLVVWARPNPPVGALGDKYRPATSYVTVATKARNRYFDLDAVRQPASENTHSGGNTAYPDRDRVGDDRVQRVKIDSNPAGAPPLDYWVLPTAPYAGSHYATFPPDLVVKPVKSMCPQRVCRVCGEPSRRIVETERVPSPGRAMNGHKAEAGGGERQGGEFWSRAETTSSTLGWTDCGCVAGSDQLNADTGRNALAKWRTGVCLDPFAGSGTTLAVATGHGRDAIGIDLDPRNAELALDRVGPLLLTIETCPNPTAA